MTELKIGLFCHPCWQAISSEVKHFSVFPYKQTDCITGPLVASTEEFNCWSPSDSLNSPSDSPLDCFVAAETAVLSNTVDCYA